MLSPGRNSKQGTPWAEIRFNMTFYNDHCHTTTTTTTTTTAIGLSPGGSSPTLVETRIKITQNNKITTKQSR